MKIYFDQNLHDGRGGFLHEGASVIPYLEVPAAEEGVEPTEPTLPDHVVEITAEEFADAMAGQGKGKEIWPGADGKPELRDPAPPSPEQMIGNIKAIRNNMLIETDKLVQRHGEQVQRGARPSLSIDAYKALLDQRQQLRDIPNAIEAATIALPTTTAELLKFPWPKSLA